MADKTLTVNGQPFTFNRDKFAGVRTMTRTTGVLPLTDSTTSIQVTVDGHADISGIYTGTTVDGATWTQQGGSGTITASNFTSTDGYTYLLEDADTDPQTLLNTGAGFTDRPWKAVIPSGITITGIVGTETVTVDRTASVIDSDRKGESRPLLSKVVGGAAAAYSLRDLNDKQGNNKVVRVRRASDNAERDFLAKEVSNGTLTDFVNTKYVSDYSSGLNGWLIRDDLTGTGNVDGIGGLDDSLQLTIGSATSVHRTFRTGILPVSQTMNFSIRVFIPSSNSVVDSLRIADASNTEIIASTTPARDQWVTLTASNITPTNSAGQLRLFLQSGGVSSFTGNGSDVIYIREVIVSQVALDGFVETWYDQSGNGNDATQPTSDSQPKIVDGGNYLGELDFNIDSFEMPAITAKSIFAVMSANTSATGSNKLIPIVANETTSAKSYIFISNNQSPFNTYAISLDGHNQDTAGSWYLNGTFKASGGNLGTFGDIVSGQTMLQTIIYTASDEPATTVSRIGKQGTNIEMDGTFKELIIYSSDQSANRPAIEANINNQHEIYS